MSVLWSANQRGGKDRARAMRSRHCCLAAPCPGQCVQIISSQPVTGPALRVRTLPDQLPLRPSRQRAPGSFGTVAAPFSLLDDHFLTDGSAFCRIRRRVTAGEVIVTTNANDDNLLCEPPPPPCSPMRFLSKTFACQLAKNDYLEDGKA